MGGQRDADDDWHTRNDSLWVQVALGRGLHGSFDFFGFNPLGQYEGDDGPQLAAMVPGGRFPSAVKRMYKGLGDIHHIATVYADFGVEFQALFKKAGMEINDFMNALPMPKHRGPHSQAYNDAVYDRLKAAIGSKTGDAAKSAFVEELIRLRREIMTGVLQL